MERYMQACSQAASPRVIAAVTDALLLKLEEEEPWMCPITLATICSEADQEQGGRHMTKVIPEELKGAQDNDPVLGKVRGCHEKSKTQSKRKRDTHKVYMGNEEDSEDDNDWRSLETRPTKQLAESMSQLRLEEDELQSRGMGEELDLELEVEQAMPTLEICEGGNRSSEKVADVIEEEKWQKADGRRGTRDLIG
ncbi:hypothetical protein KOW79_004335 [Hemibagrus wyckioides]|uniref:Uncharacterized protein n=1 Tax=Hemibagrus wyckioides TaxID=337641 RepID=A0A9D3P0P0_9TELE|nr:hypothetical protein KOW79_004335 [Hemibagrus wyckioides]